MVERGTLLPMLVLVIESISNCLNQKIQICLGLREYFGTKCDTNIGGVRKPVILFTSCYLNLQRIERRIELKHGFGPGGIF